MTDRKPVFHTEQYEAIAAAMSRALTVAPKGMTPGVYLAIGWLGSMLAADNENFTKERFVDAVEIGHQVDVSLFQ